MRYLTAQVGYVALVLVVLATATAAVFNLYEMTAKPARAWDADIDRIIAQQQEKKRLAALTPQNERAEPAKAATASTEAQTVGATAMAASLAEDEGRAERKAETASQTSKRPGRRGAAGRRRGRCAPVSVRGLKPRSV